MFVIGMAYLLAALTASALFVAVGWRSGHVRGKAVKPGSVFPYDPLWGESARQTVAPDGQTDVGWALRTVLDRLAPLLATQSVRVEAAVPPNLTGRMRGPVLMELLEAFLTAAIQAASGGRILVTAALYGERIYIAVSDGRPQADVAVRQRVLRALTERVALAGASLDLDIRPDEGTTMVLRIAALANDWQDGIHRTPRAVRPAESRVSFDRIH